MNTTSDNTNEGQDENPSGQTATPPAPALKKRTPALLLVVAGLVVGAAYGPSRPYALTLLVLLGLVTLHEAGHFFAARFFKVATPEFAVGFGPVVWAQRFGHTQYSLRAIPLGGFVRIEGMETGGPEPRGPSSGPGRSVREVSRLAQVVIAAAGPLVNIAVALVACIIVFGPVGVPKTTLTVKPVSAQAPAALAGIKEGDTLVAINGQAVQSWNDSRKVISSLTPGTPVAVTVDRDGAPVVLEVIPNTSPTGQALLGIESLTITERRGPVPAIVRGAQMTGELFVQSVKGIASFGKVIVDLPSQFLNPDQASPNRVVSPVGAAQLADQTASEQGAAGVLMLIALVSMFLAVFNLLPIPPFDGGHILLSTCEAIASKVRRRSVTLDRSRIAPIALLVTVVVGLLGVSAIVLDIVHPLF